jgi:mono/diheme cytochrome c family protein
MSKDHLTEDREAGPDALHEGATPLPDDEGFHEQERESDINVARYHDAILREKPEPRDGYEPVPLWLVTLFSLVVFWGGGYLFFYSGGFDGNVFDHHPKFGPQTVAAKGPPDPKQVGKRLFTANCVVCHQSTGQGIAGQFPPLAGSEWVLGEASNRLGLIVLYGLQGPVQVKGQTFNGAMPAWGAQLKDEQVAAILTYIRSEWGNNAPPIPPDAIKALRAEHKDRKEQWSQAELQKIPPKDVSQAGGPAPAPPAGQAPQPPPSQPAAPSPSPAPQNL